MSCASNSLQHVLLAFLKARCLCCAQGRTPIGRSIPSDVFSIKPDESDGGDNSACQSAQQSSACVGLILLTHGLGCAHLHESELAQQRPVLLISSCSLPHVWPPPTHFSKRGFQILCSFTQGVQVKKSAVQFHTRPPATRHALKGAMRCLLAQDLCLFGARDRKPSMTWPLRSGPGMSSCSYIVSQLPQQSACASSMQVLGLRIPHRVY